MLIQALCEYAGKRGSSIEEGWCRQQVHYRIMLSPDGDITNIVDIREEKTVKGKNGKDKTTLIPIEIKLPFRQKFTGIRCYYGEHRPNYIFGLDYDSKLKKFTVNFEKHNAFVKHELEFYDELDSKMCTAYRKFVEKWNPEDDIENRFLTEKIKNFSVSCFCFGLEGEKANLEDDEQFIAKYKSLIAQNKDKNTDSENQSVCAVLGEKLPVARIHDSIKLAGGQASGCGLVCMKESAFESYGKKQSNNSNISEKAMKLYTSALNGLLADKRHHITIKNMDMTLIYFAMKKDDSEECDIFSLMYGKSADDGTEIENILSSSTHDAVKGITSDTEKLLEYEKNNDVTFYIAGLTPNASRISQKFIIRDKFYSIVANAQKHQNDMKIGSRTKPIYFDTISRELVSPKSSKEKVKTPAPLMTDIILAALAGKPYPRMLLGTVVRRVKIDNDTDKNKFNIRAGIIKACINRNLNKEEIKMSLDRNNKNPAYLCGRLFAVYEKIQKDSAATDLNRTIKDSYFSSACSIPGVILPRLEFLSKSHMKKLESNEQKAASAYRLKKEKSEIMDGFDDKFPGTLSLEEQGEFIVGYYQQMNDFYVSNSTKNGKEE